MAVGSAVGVSVGSGVVMGVEIVLDDSVPSTELKGGGSTTRLVGATSGTSVVTGLAELWRILVLLMSVPLVGIGVA